MNVQGGKMKTAIISVTDHGALLAAKMAAKLTCKIDLFAKAGQDGGTNADTYESLVDLVADIYNKYNGLIFIMATGIVVRLIAPHIRDKRFDPAIVVVDEAGRHAISLLAGHLGGANELTRTVAAAAGGTPVITAMTDAAHKPAPDLLAARIGFELEPFDQLKHINAAIAAGQRVAFFIDCSLPNQEYYAKQAAEQGIVLVTASDLVYADRYDAAVVITDKEMYMVKPHLFLRPATLSIGADCRPGVTSAAIFTAVAASCRKIGRSVKSVAVIATAASQEDEIGLLAMVQQMAVPLELYSNEQLQHRSDQTGGKIAELATKQAGGKNVCEAAALLAARTDQLLLGRTVYDQVTVAIAEIKSPS
jgi:Cobalamin biosynthesis protein CbiG